MVKIIEIESDDPIRYGPELKEKFPIHNRIEEALKRSSSPGLQLSALLALCASIALCINIAFLLEKTLFVLLLPVILPFCILYDTYGVAIRKLSESSADHEKEVNASAKPPLSCSSLIIEKFVDNLLCLPHEALAVVCLSLIVILSAVVFIVAFPLSILHETGRWIIEKLSGVDSSRMKEEPRTSHHDAQKDIGSLRSKLNETDVSDGNSQNINILEQLCVVNKAYLIIV